MKREDIFAAVDSERAYQDKRWGREWDDKNTANDWLAYIASYVGQALTLPWNKETFHAKLIKVMALCCAALERESYPPRHYDSESR
jgi:hypothetical protein